MGHPLQIVHDLLLYYFEGEQSIEFTLVVMLRICWIAGMVTIAVASMPFSKLSPFRNLVNGFAARGKTLQSSTNSRFTVPQSYFFHFYLWAIVWNTFLLVATWIYAGSFGLQGNQKSIFLLLLMEFQVIRRLYETLFVFIYSPLARMHIFGYLTGMVFYTLAPLTLYCHVAPMAVSYFFTTESEARSLRFSSVAIVGVTMEWCELIGLVVSIWGWVHQFRCHVILSEIRKKNDLIDKYAIPYGDWFGVVSSPHYLAEIIIYFGFVIGSGGNDVTLWLLFGFVFANLVIAAGETHKWYRVKFEEYPMDRWAIIPFVF